MSKVPYHRHRCRRTTDSGFSRTLRNNSGVAYDASGWAARMDVRTAQDKDEGTLAFTLTETDGITLGADGTVTVHLSPAKKALLTEDATYYYDVIVDPTGDSRVLVIEGDIIANDTVTGWATT